MGYYNYHGHAKKLITNGELIKYTFVEDYKGIRPALVLFFKHNKPMPIREERWQEYLNLIKTMEGKSLK